MLLLALDTATPAVTVAVTDGQGILGVERGEGATKHGELLGPAIESVLRQAGAAPADLTDVAVGVGPGPFTGLRVGIVTARTLAASLGLTAHGVCTLDIVAADVRLAEPFIVATDARRKEVYWAEYDADGRRVGEPQVSKPHDLGPLPVFGRGAQMYAEVLRYAEGPLDPDAATLADIVVSRTAVELPLEPLYLRRPDVTLT